MSRTGVQRCLLCTEEISMTHIHYIGKKIPQLFHITMIYTIHYFEYARDFHFDGERHDFWEFIYVDSGNVDISQGSRKVTLTKDEIAFHRPMEFHDVHATKTSAPNLIVMSFQCRSSAMQFFSGKVLHLNATERKILADIIKEAKGAFSSSVADPYLAEIELSEDGPAGALQLMCNQLETFLILLYRRCSTSAKAVEDTSDISKMTQINNRDMQYETIIKYMADNVDKKLSIADICHHTVISRSQLYRVFRNHGQESVMETFSRMKIDAASHMIRETSMQFQQISEALNYSSLQYFSRQFHKITGKAPSEYATSVKAMSERDT